MGDGGHDRSILTSGLVKVINEPQAGTSISCSLALSISPDMLQWEEQGPLWIWLNFPDIWERRLENVDTSNVSFLFFYAFFFGSTEDWTQGPRHAGKALYCWATPHSDDSHTKEGAYPVFYNGKENANDKQSIVLKFWKALLFLCYRKVFAHLSKFS